VAKIAIVFGVLLVILGVGGYVATDRVSLTAMIPAIPGLILIGLGAASMASPSLNKHLMHAAATVALLGFGGAVPGVIKLFRWMGGTEPARPAAVVSQTVMAGLMLVFLVLCIRSFINARRSREAGATLETRA
jgi:hypothetical protein